MVGLTTPPHEGTRGRLLQVLPGNRVGRLPVWTMAPQEARRTGKTLNKRLRAISGVIEMSRQEMALPSEFRQRLVADVVTGRLDVRQDASDPLTDESITDRTDVSSSEVDQNLPSTQCGITLEATS